MHFLTSKVRRSAALLSVSTALAGCSGTSTSTSDSALPLVTPQVKAASPDGFTGAKSALLWLRTNLPAAIEGVARADDPPGTVSIGQQFKDRFYSGGPTDMLNTLLPYVDGILTTLNEKNPTSACRNQAPVTYTVQPVGESQPTTLYAQCWDDVSAPGGASGFVQFGEKSNTTYIYIANALEQAALLVKPAGNSGQFQVSGWLTLGAFNKASGCDPTPGVGADWDTCSYGVMHLDANPSSKHFEISVAGIGFGFCGAQLVSDGNNIYATGSSDMGDTCVAVADSCLSAKDLQPAANCTIQKNFQLAALGRKGSARSAAASSPNDPANNGQTVPTWGASTYPAAPNVVLDGTSSDAVHAGLGGPSAPSTGVGKL